MTSADVDWAAVERRGRRRDLLGVPAIALFFAAMVAVRSGQFGFWHGAAAWAAAAVPVVVCAVVAVIGRLVPRLRARQDEAHRIQHALRAHVDPGPELRGRLDVHARYIAGLGWAVWLFPALPLVLLLSARWDRPAVTVPAGLVLVGVAVAFALHFRRQVTAARRWVADPPGPPREVSPPALAKVRVVHRTVLALMGVLVLLVAGAAVLVAVAVL